jgi:hypothetical protein
MKQWKKMTFDEKLNHVKKDDGATMWVKWGPYDCKFDELPARALATVADEILRDNEPNN